MRSFLPAVLILAAGCSPPAGSGGTAVATQEETVESMRPGTSVSLAELPVDVELGANATEVRLPLGQARESAMAAARDPNRTLVLRVEGISVEQQPGVVYEVFVGGQSVGVLSFYGAEAAQGDVVSTFIIDEAAAHALQQGDALDIVFKPQGRIEEGREVPVAPAGRVRFKRLRLAEEKLPQ